MVHLHGSFSSERSGMIGTSAEGASVIFQRLSGAVWPLTAKADFKMTNVLAGKALNLLHCETALVLRPVISAMGELPPRASITAEVVFRCAITWVIVAEKFWCNPFLLKLLDGDRTLQSCNSSKLSKKIRKFRLLINLD